MNKVDKDLTELLDYQFTSISLDQLIESPYIYYVNLYRKYDKFTFYKGYIRPTFLERAKIYRAFYLTSEKLNNLTTYPEGNIICFITSEGIIIKCIPSLLHIFSEQFEKYMIESDNYIFIPDICKKLNMYEYTYYCRAINKFIENERIKARLSLIHI